MKKKRIVFLLIIFVINCTLIGCEKETSKSIDEPEINIVFMDKQFKEYIKKARSSKSEIDKLYKEIIFDPIKEEFMLKNENSSLNLKGTYIENPIRNLDKLEKEVDILVKEDVVSIVGDSLKKCNKFIQGADTTVYIFPYDPDEMLTVYQTRGIRGFSELNSKNIVLSINPTAEDWKNAFPHFVAHEYHHIIWSEMNDKVYPLNLLDCLIIEGSADSFARIVYPQIHTPWEYFEGKNEEKEVWDKIKSNLDSTDFNYYKQVMFGEDGEFPIWSGYKIGYSIVQEFIKNNPDVSIKEWTTMSANEILEKSGYEDKFKNIE